MSLVGQLIGFGFRQVIGNVAGDEAGEISANVAGPVVQLVERHFSDHSQALPKALARANDQTWQALAIALAGDGFLDQVKVFVASGDDKGIREQVSLFLQDKNIAFEGTSADFRKRCLVELKTARKIGRLSANGLSSKEIARHTAGFKRYSDPKGLVDGAEQVMGQIATELAAEFPNLGQLLRQRSGQRPPLLLSAFAYFFRREVETNDELARGLFFDGLRQLSSSQAQAFAEVGKALTTLGDNFDQVFEQLERIETAVVETQTVVDATHEDVLGMRKELQRLGILMSRLVEELRLASNVGMPTPGGPFEEITEDTIRLILRAYASGDLARVRRNYTTAIGGQVLEWLVQQSWFGKKPFPIILERKSSGNRFELVCIFNEPDGIEKVSFVLFLEDGAMKFHDLFLFNLKGDVFNMFLSNVIMNPVLARVEFGLKNPGKIWKSLLGG